MEEFKKDINNLVQTTVKQANIVEKDEKGRYKEGQVIRSRDGRQKYIVDKDGAVRKIVKIVHKG